MDQFTYETVERMERFATFLVNFKGRIMDVRGPAATIARTQVATWSLIETDLSGRLKDEQRLMEEAANASRVISSSRLHETLLEHINDMERLVTRLRSEIGDAELLEQQMYAADRELASVEESVVDAGAYNLRQYADAIRNYLEVQSSRY